MDGHDVHPATARPFVAATAFASLTGPALATPPVSETSVDDTRVVPASTEGFPLGNPCPFDITYDNQGTFLITTYFDSTGAPVRQLIRSAHVVETFLASSKEISSVSPAVQQIDLAANTLIVTGNQRHFIVPGVGIVLADAGRWVWNLDPFRLISFSGLGIPPGSEICAFLGP